MQSEGINIKIDNQLNDKVKVYLYMKYLCELDGVVDIEKVIWSGWKNPDTTFSTNPRAINTKIKKIVLFICINHKTAYGYRFCLNLKRDSLITITPGTDNPVVLINGKIKANKCEKMSRYCFEIRIDNVAVVPTISPWRYVPGCSLCLNFLSAMNEVTP
jgi:hypothetical protein